MPTAPYVLVFLATRLPTQYVVSSWSTTAPTAMSTAPGIRARAGTGAWGSFQDTHHHPAKDSPVVSRTARTAPAAPAEVRTSLTATPSADPATARPVRASFGASPAGFTLGTRQMSQCTTYSAFSRLPAVMNIVTTAPRTSVASVPALWSATFTTVPASTPVIPASLASCAGSFLGHEIPRPE